MHGFPLFWRLSLRAFSTNRGRLVELTPKRFFLQCLFIPGLLLGSMAHAIGFLLDDIFFPEYRRVEVKEPVFVVGIARSGTTFLHRLLSEDAGRFTTFKFWELILAPSIVERKCLCALSRVDAGLGGWVRKLVVKFDDWLLGDFRAMHHLSLFEPEEDEWLLMHRFASAFLAFAFPFTDGVRHLLYFDEETASADKARIMAYYKACVQRHLYVHGPEKRLLSKNPSFSAKVESIRDTFPDAKIVCCVRNPSEALPSFASLMWFIWGEKPGQSTATAEMRETLLEVMDHFYRHPLKCLRQMPENRHAFILYDALTTHPRDAVTDLYRRFEIAMTPAFEETLGAHQDQARRYKSSHAYALEHYGLTRQDILDRYEDIFDYYGFNRQV